MQKIRSGMTACLRSADRGAVKSYDDVLVLVVRVLFIGMLIVLVVDECAFRTVGSDVVRHAVFSICEAAALLLAAWKPVVGSWLIVVCSQAGGLLPFGASSVLLFACLLGVAVLGFRAVAQGCVATVICVCEYIMVNSTGGKPLVLVNVALYAMTVFVCALAGALLCRSLRDLTAAQRQAVSRKRGRLALTLHNETCNDVAYIIRRIDEIRGDSQSMDDHDMAELRSVLENVLRQTRSVVSIMANDADDDTAGGRNGVVADRAVRGRERQLRSIATKYEERLRRLGFEGETIIDIQDGGVMTDDDYALISAMLSELFSDIVKHADPEGGYFVTIGLTSARFSLSACDKPSGKDSVAVPTRMGLQRYADQVESRGGTIGIRSSQDRWIADIDLPL